MMSEETLRKKLAVITVAPPCPRHGRETLEICREFDCESVACLSCSRSCQCWNDD